MSFAIKETFWENGPSPGGYYNFGYATQVPATPAKHTMYPSVTGTSVLGIKYADGVILAADTLGSYGSMARYSNISRLMRVNASTVIGAGGDYADFQFIKSLLEQKVIDEECADDGFTLKPKAVHSWLTRVLYNRRTKINPLWNTILVAGIQDNEPFLGYVDKLGVAYEAPTLACGYGAYIAQPLLRDVVEKNPSLTEAQAKQALDRSMRVLVYRDGRAVNKYEVAVVSKTEAAKIEAPRSSKTDWVIADMVCGYE